MKLDLYLSETKTSKEAFAKTIGCSPEAVRLWCNGARTPRRGMLARLQEVTEGRVTYADFFDGAN